MQRAAASDRSKPSSAPQTPAGEYSSKRRRTGDYITSNRDSTTSTPTTTNPPSSFKDRLTDPISFSPGSDLPSHNLKSYAGEHYETQWVLDLHIPEVQNPNEQDQDSDTSTSSHDIWSPSHPSGVQTYGAFKRKSTTSKQPSISKSARRNSSRKRDANEADLSSLSSNADSDSNASDSEPNTYTHSRTNQARHKANAFNPNSNSTILGRDHHQLTDQSDYFKFDNSESRSSNTNSNLRGRNKNRNRDRDNIGELGRNGFISIGGDGGRNFGGGGGGGGNSNGNAGGSGGRKKKVRKTM